MRWAAVIAYPHLTDQGREQFLLARQARAGWLGKRYDSQGNRILTTFEDTFGWFAQQGLVA